MDFKTKITKLLRKNTKKAIAIKDRKMQGLVNQGREEFKQLIDKGINIPVALL